MKKGLVAGIIGMALLTGGQLMADEGHAKMGSEFCAKHCSATQLKAEVTSLEKKIAADRVALKSSGGGEKLATLMAKKDQVKKHLNQHIKELEALKAEADKAEAELNQMGTK